MKAPTPARRLLLVPVILCALFAGGAAARVQDLCGPFTDVSAAICPYVLEMYYLGITAGTSPTTYSPDATLTRGQAAVFVSKGVNQAIARSSRRAALGQWWTTTPHYDSGLGFTPLNELVTQPCSDGVDIWVPSLNGPTTRVRASDGAVLGAWTNPHGGSATLCAMGKVFVLGFSGLFMIDPTQPPGAATLVTDQLGLGPNSLAFDGSRIWTANPVGQSTQEPYPPGSISIVTPGTWTVQTIDLGSIYPIAIIFDGTNMWATADSSLLRFDSAGAIVQTVTVGDASGFPVFDGANIWVPSAASSVSVVRAATGDVVATLTGNGLEGATTAAFDGSRVLVMSTGGQISLWDAQSLAPLGHTEAGLPGIFAISDGLNFWLTLSNFSGLGGLARF